MEEVIQTSPSSSLIQQEHV